MNELKATNQKEIIVQMILRAVKHRYDPAIAVVLSGDEKHQLQDQILKGFEDGSIPCKRDKTRRGDLRYYAGNMISEWLRKDRRLNGGKKHKAKKDPKLVYEPFAEEHFRGDPKLIALIRLRSAFETKFHITRNGKDKSLNFEKIEEINRHIKRRVQELVLEKHGVDIRQLPSDLIAALGLIPSNEDAA